MHIVSKISGIIFFIYSIVLSNYSVCQAEEVSDARNKTYKIYMVLWNGPTDVEVGFQQYLEQQNVKAEYIVKDCTGDKKKCHALVADIKNVKPDLVFTWSTPAAVEIAGSVNEKSKEDYLWEIPIVSTLAADPVKSELIYDLNAPGRNVTGVSHIAPMQMQMKTILSYAPLKKMAALYVTTEKISTPMVKAFEKECKERGIEYIGYPYPHLINGKLDVSKLEPVFKKMKEDGIELVYFPPSNIMSAEGATVCAMATKYNLMTFTGTELMVKKGPPLLALISSNINIGRLAGQKAEEILIKKRDIKNIPYQAFDKFAFVISKNVMQQLKVYPPLLILDSAVFIDRESQKAEAVK